METVNRAIHREAVSRSFTYEAYRELVKTMAEQNDTKGEPRTEDHSNYTKLNDRRMDRLEKTLKLVDEMEPLKGKWSSQEWWVITESWCGDAAQNLPGIALVAAHTGASLQMILRDENPEVMDRFLTNGARSIPKLVVTDKHDGSVLAEWGPRPAPAQQLVKEARANGIPASVYNIDLQQWYNRDKSTTLQRELIELMSSRI